MKGFPWKKVHDLRKQCLPGIHQILSAPMVCQEEIVPDLRSSRGHPYFAVTNCVKKKKPVPSNF
jgi:hypothetical protein